MTNWTENTASASGFTENTASSTAYTEASKSGDLWTGSVPNPGAGIDYVLLGLPIQEMILPGAVGTPWTEAALI